MNYQLILGALDILGVALANHGHTWTEKERELFDKASAEAKNGEKLESELNSFITSEIESWKGLASSTTDLQSKNRYLSYAGCFEKVLSKMQLKEKNNV